VNNAWVNIFFSRKYGVNKSIMHSLKKPSYKKKRVSAPKKKSSAQKRVATPKKKSSGSQRKPKASKKKTSAPKKPKASKKKTSAPKKPKASKKKTSGSKKKTSASKKDTTGSKKKESVARAYTRNYSNDVVSDLAKLEKEGFDHIYVFEGLTKNGNRSQKFWAIKEASHNSYTVVFGAVGSVGNRKTIVAKNNLKEDMFKLMRQKAKKGYTIVPRKR